MEAIDRRQGAVNMKFHQESKRSGAADELGQPHAGRAVYAGRCVAFAFRWLVQPGKILDFVTERLEHLG